MRLTRSRWRYENRYRAYRFRRWISGIQYMVHGFWLWLTDPDTLQELQNCVMGLIAAWIALGIVFLWLWAGAQ